MGKSAFIVQFISGTFVEKYDPTIEDFYRKEVFFYNSSTVLEILDTAGTEQFASMRDLYIKNGQGFVLMYSIVKADTFTDDVRPLRDQIHRVKGRIKDVPMVLVGNKCDLDGEREVPTKDGENLAQEWGCSFFESSAKTCHNVHEVFSKLIEELMQSWSKSSCGCCIVL